MNIGDGDSSIVASHLLDSQPKVESGQSVGDSFDKGSLGARLFDDDGLADTIAAITARTPQAADEFNFYILLVIDGLRSGASDQVSEVLKRSVELAFPFTETFKAALDLYILDKSGRLTGRGTSGELIRDLIRTRS
jgi:hypothetical protein